MKPFKMLDAQAALAFVNSQATYIEPQVEKIEYPSIQYPDLIPVDFSAPEWIKSVTYYSSDGAGKAQWFHHQARDVPMVGVDRTKFETTVEMAAIGYGWTLEEISQAQWLGMNLDGENADLARRVYEEFVDDVALNGDVDKGFSGLIDHPSVTSTLVPNDGAGGLRTWASKTPVQILRDINVALTNVWVDTKQIEVIDTILLPPSMFSYLITTYFDDHATKTIFQALMETNVYTATTGRPLTIKAVRGLETAGAGSTGRMVVYSRNPRVLKLHIPMRLKWIEAMRVGPLMYQRPGIFRLGGLDVKRPAAMHYWDGISPT